MDLSVEKELLDHSNHDETLSKTMNLMFIILNVLIVILTSFGLFIIPIVRNYCSNNRSITKPSTRRTRDDQVEVENANLRVVYSRWKDQQQQQQEHRPKSPSSKNNKLKH